MAKRITYRCKRCGSGDVERMVWANWSDKVQMWTADKDADYDYSYCKNCGGYEDFVEKHLDG